MRLFIIGSNKLYDWDKTYYKYGLYFKEVYNLSLLYNRYKYMDYILKWVLLNINANDMIIVEEPTPGIIYVNQDINLEEEDFNIWDRNEISYFSIDHDGVFVYGNQHEFYIPNEEKISVDLMCEIFPYDHDHFEDFWNFMKTSHSSPFHLFEHRAWLNKLNNIPNLHLLTTESVEQFIKTIMENNV